MARKLLFMAAVALLTLIMGVDGLASVGGSRHDLAPPGPSAPGENVDPLCRPCHVPHSAAAPKYLSPPSGAGTLCAGCHDGTVAGWVGGMDHPVEIAYPAREDLRRPDGSRLKLQKGQDGSDTLTCATCHDPHAEGGVAKMLRVSNSGSALCLTCHLK